VGPGAAQPPVESVSAAAPVVEELPPEQSPLYHEPHTYSATDVELGSGPTRVTLTRQPSATRLEHETAFAVAAPRAMPSSATVVVRDAIADTDPGLVFHVYLGERENAYHIGQFSFYDATRHPRTFRLDATVVARRIADAGGPWVVYVVAAPVAGARRAGLVGEPRLGAVELVTR
jgi:hypothetical protein